MYTYMWININSNNPCDRGQGKWEGNVCEIQVSPTMTIVNHKSLFKITQHGK